MDKKKVRSLLLEQRKRLQDDRGRSEGREVEKQQQRDSTADLSAFDNHPADQGSETFERQRALAIMDRIDARIQEVDEALARLEDGRFGKCEICGQDIPEERLVVRPETRFCVDHQAEVERGAHPEIGR